MGKTCQSTGSSSVNAHWLDLVLRFSAAKSRKNISHFSAGEKFQKSLARIYIAFVTHRGQDAGVAVTVGEVLIESADYLAARGVTSARLEAEILLAQVVGLRRLELGLNFQRRLRPEEMEKMHEYSERRGRREPLQHILGTACFCGLDIAVTPQVMVPRPETELLAERAWTFLNSAAIQKPHPLWVLDFGTGSGCLAIAIAVQTPQAKFYAVDTSLPALAVAKANCTRYQKCEQIALIACDGLSAVPSRPQFRLIVANPPYIPSAEILELEPEVKDYEPGIALDGGPDGMEFYRRLAREAATYLEPDGGLMIEFGDGQETELRELFRAQGWQVEAVQNDYTGRPRIMELKALIGTCLSCES